MSLSLSGPDTEKVIEGMRRERESAFRHELKKTIKSKILSSLLGGEGSLSDLDLVLHIDRRATAISVLEEIAKELSADG